MRFSVIVATLMRPSLQELLRSLKVQTLNRSEWELLTWTGGFNEYDARNQAARIARSEWLCFVDDDCIAAPNWLESADKVLCESKNEIVCISGALEGDLWGKGQTMRLAEKGWYPGANLFVKKTAFDEIEGFETDWGLSPRPKGWRGDTDLGFRLEDRFGEDACVFSNDVLVYHPRPMQSIWQPDVERLFYLRHRGKCLERFAPIDPRLCQFVIKNNIESDPAIIAYLGLLLDRFFGRTRPRPGFYYACNVSDCKDDFLTLKEFQGHLSKAHQLPESPVSYRGFQWHIPKGMANYIPLEPHEQNIVAWVNKILSNTGGTFIDVGANTGLYSITLAHNFDRVFAIEPEKEYLNALTQNVVLNKLSHKVIVLPMAASDMEDTPVLLAKVGHGDFSILQPGEEMESDAHTEETKTMTINSLCRKEQVTDLRFLKVDVEGQGHRVLSGASATLSSAGEKWVLFESHYRTGGIEEDRESQEIMRFHRYELQNQWWQSGARHDLWHKS